jgi:TonB family protein
MNITRALGIAVTVACATAAPRAASAQGQIVTQPDWVRKPSMEQLMKVLPNAAAKGQDGSAIIGCQVNIDGALHDCKVLAEAPLGMGFGPAAVALAPLFRMKPMTLDGKPVAGGEVKIPINWKFGGRPIQLGPPVTNKVAWRAAPTFDQVVASYPQKAREEAKSGRVLMTCTYMADGHLKDCAATVQEPTGYGFGPAAKSLAVHFEGPPLGDELKKKKILAQISVAYASETLQGRRRVGKPNWLALPSGDAVAGTYPETARETQLTGRATLDCAVQEHGRVGGCTVLAEDPPGARFGEAALKLSAGFVMTVWTDEGLPTVGGRISIPIRYQLASGSAEQQPKP